MVTDAHSDHVRVSDAERQFVVDRLRDETSARRLTLDEFDERAGAAYAARTRADLLHLLRNLPQADLPTALPGEPVVVDPLAGPPDLGTRARRRYRTRMRNELAGFACANGTVTAIDVFTGGGWQWSRWVLLFTGIGLVSKALKGTESDREAELREWHKQHGKVERDQAEQPAPVTPATA